MGQTLQEWVQIISVYSTCSPFSESIVLSVFIKNVLTSDSCLPIIPKFTVCPYICFGYQYLHTLLSMTTFIFFSFCICVLLLYFIEDTAVLCSQQLCVRKEPCNWVKGNNMLNMGDSGCSVPFFSITANWNQDQIENKHSWKCSVEPW